VEMEGAAVAQVCHDYGLPFAALSPTAPTTAPTSISPASSSAWPACWGRRCWRGISRNYQIDS
jgi:hypothetical protein